MAHFHKVPNGEHLSGSVLTVNGKTTIGLYGPGDGSAELEVTSSVASITPVKGSRSGDSRLWEISGSAGQSVLIQAMANKSNMWDQFHIRFRTGGADVTVRPMAKEMSWGEHALNPVGLPQINVIDVASFRAGKDDNVLQFTASTKRKARLGVFACSKGSETRAAILMLPETGKPERVLIGISHSFGQNPGFYGGLGWSDPLSKPLIDFVSDKFVTGVLSNGEIGHGWGSQMVASSNKNMALLLPVRANGGNNELGPFAKDGAFVEDVLDSISLATDNAFTAAGVEAFTFSNGILDLNPFIGALSGHLSLKAVYSIDPLGALPASQIRGVTYKQFQSGEVGKRAGFEYLPENRWAKEIGFPNRKNMGGPKGYKFQYLHNRCLPLYTLYLGIQTS